MGYLKIVIAILIWSSLGIFIRMIGIPSEGIVFYSTAIAALLQLPLFLISGQKKVILKTGAGPNKLSLFILLPVFSLINTLLFYFAFAHTTIANAVLTHYTAPVFVALTAPLVLNEKITKAAWASIILSSLGLWLILGSPSMHEWSVLDINERNGIIAGAGSGLAYALIILVLRKIASEYSSLFIIFVQNSVIALLLLPLVLMTQMFSLRALPYLIVMGLLHSTIAPLLYVQGFRSVRANEAAILGYFEPVGAIFLAFVFLHELPALSALAGGLLILFSGYLIMRAKSKGRDK